MKVKQFIGPFEEGILETGLSEVHFVQIGIERPHGAHYLENTFKIPIIINDNKYSINEYNDILEFENLNLDILKISIPTHDEDNGIELDTRYLIIDIAYE